MAGKILWVDLTTEEYEILSTADYVKEFLGGVGLNWWLLYKGVKPWVTPYEPANLLLYGTGLLVGTLVPCATRFTVDSKNPFTNGIASSNSGGHFSAELKYAGYDHIVFRGRARRPVYLCLDDDRIVIKDASHLWGRTTYETNDLIKEELKDQDFQVSCIGPAGENLVRSACIVTNRARAAGKCGLGAVMGSKNLKGIAVRGSGVIEVQNPEKFMELVEEGWEKIKKSQIYEDYSMYGTLDDTPFCRLESSAVPFRNFQDDYMDPDRAKRIRGHIYHDRYEKKRLACFVCPYHCGRFYKIDGGLYSPLAFEKMEANAVLNFGSILDINNPSAIMKAQSLCTEYGMDIDGAAMVLSWAFECYQRGMLDKKVVDGFELKWGDHKVVMELLRRTAYREGFGRILAEGVKRASEVIGKGSEKYAIHIKGMDSREVMRSGKGYALGIATALRGGGHTTGAPLPEFNKIPSEVCRTTWGIDWSSNPSLYEGKPELVFYFERLYAALNSLGICIFTANGTSPDLFGPDDYANLVSAATGWGMNGKDLMRIGEKINNVGKAFNTLHAGFDRKDDYPPKRMMEEPIKSGPKKGERLKRNEWNKMLDRYYELHNWNKKTGWQTKKCLKEFHLENVMEDLKADGKIG